MTTLAKRIAKSLIEARQERDRKIAKAKAEGRLTYTWSRHGRLGIKER